MKVRQLIAVIALVPATYQFAHADGRFPYGQRGRANISRQNLPGGYSRFGRAPTNFPGYNRSFQAARSSRYPSESRFLNAMRGNRSRFRTSRFPGFFGAFNQPIFAFPFSYRTVPYRHRVLNYDATLDRVSVNQSLQSNRLPKPRYYRAITPPDPIPPLIFPRMPRPKNVEPPLPL